METTIITATIICCSKCDEEKNITEFYRKGKGGKICKLCCNNRRREKYASNEEFRKKCIEEATKIKQKRAQERNKIKEEEEKNFIEEHGDDTKLCKYCEIVVLKTHFRHNRLKCKDCEREDPYAKFTRAIRGSIWNRLMRASIQQKKTKHTIEYLGCSYEDYFKWLDYNFEGEFNFDNWGDIWHIDHVFPISKFDLTDEKQQLIAFNWRNTTPLLAIENLQKGNKLFPQQLEQHYSKLLDYHKLLNIELPPEFINLYATQPN